MRREEVVAEGMRYCGQVLEPSLKSKHLRIGGEAGEEIVAVKTTEVAVVDLDLLLKTFHLHPSSRQS